MNGLLDLPNIKLRGQLFEEASLSQYTSWRVGGPADILYLPADLEDLSIFLKIVPKDFPLTWLGLGSNILVRDNGIEGVVIVTQGSLMNLIALNESSIRVEAGVACAQLARFSARLGLTGLEFMAGIPGTVGGALAMNAGCFGGETWNFVTAVETMDRQGIIRQHAADKFEVNYRHVKRPEGEWFVAGFFKLSQGNKEKSLADIKSFLERRNQTQPAGTANCGSVFRNPKNHFSGRLIEECGLKGKRIGGAVVSEKHANFIINDNNATATDIENLIYEVQSVVENKTGIKLHPEVHIIGRE